MTQLKPAVVEFIYRTGVSSLAAASHPHTVVTLCGGHAKKFCLNITQGHRLVYLLYDINNSII